MLLTAGEFEDSNGVSACIILLETDVWQRSNETVRTSSRQAGHEIY